MPATGRYAGSRGFDSRRDDMSDLKPAYRTAEFWLTCAVIAFGIIGAAWLIHRGHQTHAVALSAPITSVYAVGRVARAWVKRADLAANPLSKIMTLSQIVQTIENPSVRARIAKDIPAIIAGARALIDVAETIRGAMYPTVGTVGSVLSSPPTIAAA